jgi:uncharacterized RDD family membrane protein YckC
MPESKSEPRIFADFSNRACALVLDLLAVSYAVSMLDGTGLPHQVMFAVVAGLYFWGMPLTRLQGTLGKWIFRIKICDRAGKRITRQASAIRAVLSLSWIGLGIFFAGADYDGVIYSSARALVLSLFFLPYLTMGITPRNESAMDLLAGTLVVRYGAGEESIALATPLPRAGILKVGGTLLVGVLCGLTLMIFGDVSRDKGLRARVSYALVQTDSLKGKIEEFHAREKRWPDAASLSVPEWTPYPDGGGYRLGANGNIQISFTVLQGLKGHSLTLSPAPAADNRKMQWKCSADPGFPSKFLPVMCR